MPQRCRDLVAFIRPISSSRHLDHALSFYGRARPGRAAPEVRKEKRGSMMQARDYRSWEARLAAANAASEAKDWGRAAELWEQLRTERPHEPGCWLKAGEAYCQ